MKGEAASEDALWGGRLRLWQPGRGHGYRFNLDPVLLASQVAPGEHLLDLGSGCGVLAVLLLAAGVVRRATAVERQAPLAALLRRNAAANGLGGRLQVIEADLRAAALPQVDRVAFNPPYFRADAGRPCPCAGRDAARRELCGGLADFAAAAAAALAPGGHAYGIVRVGRATELAGYFAAAGLGAGALRPVAARPGTAPHNAIVAAQRPGAGTPPRLGGGAPLHVHGACGRALDAAVRPWVEGPPTAPAGS